MFLFQESITQKVLFIWILYIHCNWFFFFSNDGWIWSCYCSRWLYFCVLLSGLCICDWYAFCMCGCWRLKFSEHASVSNHFSYQGENNWADDSLFAPLCASREIKCQFFPDSEHEDVLFLSLFVWLKYTWYLINTEFFCHYCSVENSPVWSWLNMKVSGLA